MARRGWGMVGFAFVASLLSTPAAQAQACPEPVIVQVAGSNPSCPGQLLTLDAGAFASYLWSNGAATRLISDSPVTSTSYSVTITGPHGCRATSVPFFVSVPALPSAPVLNIVQQPAAFCGVSTQGGVASVSNASEYTSFSWSIANGSFTPPPDSTSSSVSFAAAGSNPVALTVRGTDVDGCSATTAVDVPVRTLAPPAITLCPPAGICPNGAPGYANVSSPSGVMYMIYAWTIANGELT